MSDLIDNSKLEDFAAYADKHNLFDIFRQMTTKLLIERPSDPFQYMIEYLRAPQLPAVIMFAPPCSGVMHIGGKLAVQLDAVYIIAAEVIQQNIQKQTTHGVQAKQWVEKGAFVPDELISVMINARLKESGMQKNLNADVRERGFVLEGYPRTKGQVINIIREKITITNLIEIDMPNSKVIERAAGLRFDPVTNKIYHLKDDPPPSNVFIQKRLIAKPTDNGALLDKRLKIYRHQIGDVIKFYKNVYRKFHMPNGVYGYDISFLNELVETCKLPAPSCGPRVSKIVVAGFPGAGRQKLAELLESKYNHVHGIKKLTLVSPKLVILEELAKGKKDLAEYKDDPESAPLPLIGPLIVKRLQREDCRNNGWILEGFPFTFEQADYLGKSGIEPNRVIWLDSTVDACKERLRNRRYHPVNGTVLDVSKVSADVKDEIFAWPTHERDQKSNMVSARFERFMKTEADLRKFYKKRTADVCGVFYTVPDKNGNVDELIERAEASLLRPVPYDLILKD